MRGAGPRVVADGLGERVGDGAPADDEVAVHQARELTWCGSVDGIVELDREGAVAAAGGISE